MDVFLAGHDATVRDIIQLLIIGLAFFTLGMAGFTCKHYIQRSGGLHLDNYHMWIHVFSLTVSSVLITLGVGINHVYFIHHESIFLGSYLFVPGFLAALIGHFSMLQHFVAMGRKHAGNSGDADEAPDASSA